MKNTNKAGLQSLLSTMNPVPGIEHVLEVLLNEKLPSRLYQCTLERMAGWEGDLEAMAGQALREQQGSSSPEI
jgi:hypothetical protein